MKKKKLKKLRSKRGLTLVEILIGITIVVVVFASTLGAMVGGFTTTIYNADENRAAVLNASVNEVIMNTIHNLSLTGKDDLEDYVDSITTDTATNNPLVAAVTATVPDAKYVAPDASTGDVQFMGTAVGDEDYTYQYSLIPEKVSDLDRTKSTYRTTGSPTTVSIKGITVKTCFYSAAGPIIYESFVPYSK